MRVPTRWTASPRGAQDSDPTDLHAVLEDDEELVIDVHADRDRGLMTQTASIMTLDEQTGRTLRSVRAMRIVKKGFLALS